MQRKCLTLPEKQPENISVQEWQGVHGQPGASLRPGQLPGGQLQQGCRRREACISDVHARGTLDQEKRSRHVIHPARDRGQLSIIQGVGAILPGEVSAARSAHVKSTQMGLLWSATGGMDAAKLVPIHGAVTFGTATNKEKKFLQASLQSAFTTEV